MFDKRLMKMCPDSKKYIAGNILLQWLELCANAMMIFIIAMTIEQFFSNNITLTSFILRMVTVAFTIAARWFTARGTVYMSYLASRAVKRIMREQIYTKLLRLGSAYREHASTAELVQESVEGVEQLESYFGQYVPQFFYAFFAPVTLFVLFGIAGSWGVASVLLICVPLIPAAIMAVQRVAKKILSKYWNRYTQLGSTFLENLQGMTTLKTYQADEYKNEQMNRESEEFRIVTMKVLTMQLNSIIIMDLFAYGGASLGIALAGKQFIDSNLGIASTVFMIMLSAEFFLPMRRLGSYFHIAMNGMAASEKIFRFLNETEPDKKTGELKKESGNIELSNISFSYEADRKILHDVSLKIAEKSFVGIVGESGSGKSTVASLIMGRNTATVGKIEIGGLDIGTISDENLLKNITYIGFGSVFFKGTVRDNLLIAASDSSDEKLRSILERCKIADFFDEEKGLDTELLENAGNLSGGQKQRLALARALLHDSPIYIFDEATSNIDIESEESILEVIRELAKQKTVVMITHRLANVSDADNIYCMEAGRVSGSGTHEELLASCDTYGRLWETQQELENLGKEVA